jgi:uncharacterized membrane protein YgcG
MQCLHNILNFALIVFCDGPPRHSREVLHRSPCLSLLLWRLLRLLLGLLRLLLLRLLWRWGMLRLLWLRRRRRRGGGRGCGDGGGCGGGGGGGGGGDGGGFRRHVLLHTQHARTG